ncbi:MAG TPA: hypothetical protein VGQ78_01700 [Vicinamibacteria bacterium]|nr:hypothetical protein [Vicinamibacteria bacterium]
MLVFVSRAAFLPPTLEDIDTVNFALALDDFDVSRHQPHPPGYPVYVAAGKLMHALVPRPVTALALVSALSQAALVFPLVAVLRGLGLGSGETAAAAALVLSNGVLWLNGARPMSDSFGLLAVLGAQALLLRARDRPGLLPAASLATALAIGVRLQAALLTLPLWGLALVRAKRGRALSVAALAAGIGLWAVPLMVQSGGVAAYRAAVARAAADSLPVEPLLAHPTPNRAARAAVWVLVRPMGWTVLLLATTGMAIALVRRRAALALALLAFGPYLLVHTLLQQVTTIRYSLPYLPLIAWLAVVGASWVLPRPAGAALAAAAVAWGAGIALPALLAYHRSASPPYAALHALGAVASPPDRFELGGHYMFFRYLGERPAAVDLIVPVPRREVAGLERHWLEGSTRTVLFLAEPERTDLESIDRRARRDIGRRQWPPSLAPLMAGERPNRVELVRIDRPDWFAGEGWLLSLEAGRIEEQRRFAERRAHLLARVEPTFLLLAGEPITAEAASFDLDLSLGAAPLAHESCGTPLLRGFTLGPRTEQGYVDLTAATRRGAAGEGAPYALRGLDYGPRTTAGLVRGNGWHYAETDEAAVPFRWASARARSLLHVPPSGAVLRLEAEAPIEYVGPGGRVSLAVDGAERASTVVQERRFVLQLELDGANEFTEVVLSSERSFVPDRRQRNGDRRELALRVYRFELQPRTAGATLR